ncbi:hypothetical protein [Actinoplanes sp. NPDC049265]|uniref:hypothetical protein n=1 Tax=Actinoplanes sp. NPDC049265 TaxID=3363902 RepID=UPI003721FAAF
MVRRKHGRMPTLALWMLVAVADVALLAAAASPLVTILVIAGLVIVAGAFAGKWVLNRPQPAKATYRRRA